MNEVQIGLSSWIIQDGNYNDFRIGDHRKFALEFFPGEVKKGKNGYKTFKRIKASTFHINAEVIYCDDGLWVIDFGYKAYREQSPPENVYTGEWIDTEIYLGIDPFFYFEGIYKSKEVPNLFYEWEIKRIEIETTPLIEVKPKYFERDPSKEGYKDIDKTDAWNDDNGNGHYILHCTNKNSQQTH
jgi:hypothetical protein